MAAKLNQHFVPQFLFRLMNGGKRYIHVANRSTGAIHRFAPIKGQCARHKYYGSKEFENWLEEFEREHSAIFRRVLHNAWHPHEDELTDDEIALITEALLLQRARTPKAVSSIKVPTHQMMMYVFHEFIRSMPDSKEKASQLEAIRNGNARFEESDLHYLAMSIDIALKCVAAVADLELVIIRNHSDIPFIMGDSPVVLSNHFMRKVKDHGVLGYMTPGLIMTLPLNERTQILFYDPGVYEFRNITRHTVDIYEQKDVSILNAVQLHESEENVYFVDEASSEYINQLITCHSKLLKRSYGKFGVIPGNRVLVEGRRMGSGELMHVYCDQLPITIGLSIFETKELTADTDLSSPRNAEISRSLENLGVLQSRPGRVGMDQVMDYLNSILRV